MLVPPLPLVVNARVTACKADGWAICLNFCQKETYLNYEIISTTTKNLV